MCESESQNNFSRYTIEQIFDGYGTFERSHEAPVIEDSPHHTVLFELPLPEDDIAPIPKCEPHEEETDFEKFVKLPCSPESCYFELNDNEEKIKRRRWDLIVTSLKHQKITDGHELEAAILSYNTKFRDFWNFKALHAFFDEELQDEDNHDRFFNDIIPKLIDLALALPDLIKAPLPFLRQKSNHALSMSKQQAACLLANAFLCTFPNRNVARKSTDYPEINFSRLYCSDPKSPHIVQKIKSICTYFLRILTVSMPTGVLTFSRRYIKDFPKWSECEVKLSTIKWHCDSKGTIENGDGMVQVDFANRYLGGGVLGYGCVQEEIRFVICPELIVGMLFCESMKPEETIHVYGSEIFSKHSGYASSFRWEGKFIDNTPSDRFRRKLSYIVAMDALSFHKPWQQFEEFLLIRETNKAYCGFHSDNESPIPIATGNWGCGAFRGDKHLKCLLQLIACAANRRNLVYYTFGDDSLMHDMDRMFTFLQEKDATIAQLWRCLTTFKNGKRKFEQLYQYIYECFENASSVGEQEPVTSEGSYREARPLVESLQENESPKSDTEDENPSKRTKIDDDSVSAAAASATITDLCEKLNEKIADKVESVSGENQETVKEEEEEKKQATILDYTEPKT